MTPKSHICKMKYRIKKRILKRKTAYAIMPVGKKVIINPCQKERIPRCVAAHQGILLFFYTGKAPSRLFVVLMIAI